MSSAPRVVREPEMTDTGQTAGILRKQAFAEPGVWVGIARTQPGTVSDWHHHGDNATYAYCVSGVLRVESGPGGTHVAEARAGEFMLIPANTVHRESNPADVEQLVVLTRIGGGQPVVTNVEGPDPAQ